MSSDNKVMLVGESGVGKTSLCHRFIYGTFPNYVGETFSLNKNEKVYHTQTDSVVVQFQDTQGFESCGSILPQSMCRGTGIILLVYALNEEDSIKSLYAIGDNIVKYMPLATKIMVGNKYDLMERNRSIEGLISGHKDLDQVDHSLKVSALTGQGIAELEHLIIQLMSKRKKSDMHTSIRLDDADTSDSLAQNSCCKL